MRSRRSKIKMIFQILRKKKLEGRASSIKRSKDCALSESVTKLLSVPNPRISARV